MYVRMQANHVVTCILQDPSLNNEFWVVTLYLINNELFMGKTL